MRIAVLSALRAVSALGLLLASPSVASAHGIAGPLHAVAILLADPDIAFVLLLIGIYGILLEFAHPGAIVPGLIGVVCLTLAALSLILLPVHYGALALLIAGIALMTAEAFTPGFGVLGLLGFAAFLGGGYFLFDGPANAGTRVSLPVILGSAVGSAALLFFVVGAAVKARRQPTVTGAEEMLAARGTVIDWSGENGNIRIRGEVWAAHGDKPLKPGDNVKVASRDGLTLRVEPE